MARRLHATIRSQRQVDGHVWAVPFQRSTAVLYWNKKAFAEAGLDQKYPKTWDEMVAYGKAVTRRTPPGA
ncbi:MAG: extracellular solute-binding protein [Betaproteobacteria bacterium]|nr:extracellular solute-binding protein [Betaproteobacteria bacterium]